MIAEDQAARLSDLTRAFYERTHASFSATRSHAWQGWEKLWSLVGDALEARAASSGRMRVADVACGNLRFVRFLSQKTRAALEAFAFDGCKPLLMEGLRAFSADECEHGVVQEKVCDIMAALQTKHDFMASAGACDLAVSFGFMHHVPLFDQRRQLLRTMAEHTAEGGFVAASFWQFAADDRLREKARTCTERAQRTGAVGDLAANDYLLDWQDDKEALRFCHHFTEDEIDELSADLKNVASEIARFSADGGSGKLNRYAVWRRHG